MRGRLLTQITGWIVSCALASAFAASPTTHPTTKPVLQHVPDEPSQARAQKMVREVYAKELASNDPEERRAVAGKMILEAGKRGDDPAARFVLLKEARDAAAGAGDALTARRAIALLAQSYAIDQPRMVLGTMNLTQAPATNLETLWAVVQVCLNTAQQAIGEDDFPTGTRAVSIAQSAAEKSKSAALVLRVKQAGFFVQAIALEFDAAAKAREVLKKDAEDAEANARVGKYLCLYKADWNGGLPLLAKGAESGLTKLAQDDLAAAKDARKRLAAGDGWWELSSGKSWIVQRNLQARAAFWYRQAVGELVGIHRSHVEKRIEMVELAQLAEQNLVPGLNAELFKTMEFKQLGKRRVDDQINFDWGLAAPDAAVGRDNFSIRWSGVLRPPEKGDYELLVIANAGARVWIDEKLVVSNGNLAKSRNGERHVVKLDQPLHPIRVEFWDSGGAARMILQWRRPGAVKDEVIPPSVFFREGLVEGP